MKNEKIDKEFESFHRFGTKNEFLGRQMKSVGQKSNQRSEENIFHGFFFGMKLNFFDGK